MKNNDKFHPFIYHRLFSLISAKNNLMIRYNIDNKKYLCKKHRHQVVLYSGKMGEFY